MNIYQRKGVQEVKIEAGVEAEEKETYDSPACRDYEEFFHRTRQRMDEEIFSKEGKVIQFSDAMVTRYLERMTVCYDAYEIEFKCGLTIQVPVT